MEPTTKRTPDKGRGGKSRKVDTCPPEEDDVLSLADKNVSIELISREVFRKLDFKDLLNCSLVNRTWRASARLHLRTHCRCFLSFSPKIMKIKRRKFSDLYDLLTNSSDVPFNGVSITTLFQQSSYHSDKEGFSSSSEDLTSSSEDVTSSVDYISSSESKEISSDELAEEDIKGNEFQEKVDRPISAPEWAGAFGRLEVKYLELDWSAEPVSLSSCTAIKEILRGSCSTLVDLTVLRWDDSRGLLLLLHYFGANVLPNVKVLQLPGDEWRRLNAVDLEDLLNALPRLQFIRGSVDLLSLPAFVRTNKQHVIREFNFDTCSVSQLEATNQLEGRNLKVVEELLELATTFGRSQPKLTKLTLLSEYQGRAHQTPENYFSVMEALVRGGSEVLKEVEIGYRDLLPFISPSSSTSHAQRHPSPVFPAVTSLSLHFEFGIFTELSSTGLDYLNLEAHFPLLHSVELDCVMGSHVFPFSDERRTEEYCCKSVRRLVVRNTRRLTMALMETTWMASFQRLFPMVRVLVMKECSDLQAICESLWGKGRALWEELRVLRLEGIVEETMRMNWDPLFTGLSQKDCDRLKGQSEPDVQFFEELRLKPREEREGSLLDLKKLEKLQLGMEHDKVCENGRGAGNAFASMLTGECVWALMGLRVEMKRRLCQKKLKCCLALNHLQPFVHFVDKFTD